MEEEVLDFWEKQKIFEAQDELRKNSKEFSFFDGPPFANGLPHYGHLLATTIKDTVLRYWVMRGFKVERRFGWDCHGLPVEFEIEKREKLKGRPDILEMGIDKFNETCRDSVFVYAKEWQKTINRMGRWIDWENKQYRTMDKNYMESVWWVFSELNKKGLIYKDFKVVPFSPRTSSVVSNFEANQNYKEVSDPSIFVKIKLKKSEEYLIVWTTTPWTLPSNLALAVGKNITYLKVQDENTEQVWIIAKDAIENLYGKKGKKKEGSFKVLEELNGDQLVDLEYEPLFSYFSDHSNAFKILHGDHVSTTDGSGIVHQAPAYGEEDFLLCRENNIGLVDPIDESGCFTKSLPEFEGLYFKDADKVICKKLKESGALIKQGTIVHSYPFDERTDTPLMYKAVPSWYVAVEKIVDKLIQNNQEIRWVPDHIKYGRMGSWLENARDWAISRNRFWGTPLPVWICKSNPKHAHVISSVKELEEKTGEKVEDLHLHFVDKLNFSCGKCGGEMRNEGLVFDCWFESGSMPYAQTHYPFEGKENFTDIFPGDFIAEGIDQTRGWFYTLQVLSAALFNKPAFKNVIVNGVILDERGKKMSKRHRNYTPPDQLIDKFGADSIRLYMLNSSLMRAEDLIFLDQGVKDVTRLVLLPLWNALSFLSTYADAESWKPSLETLSWQKKKSLEELDVWIISRFQSLLASVEDHLGEYKLYLVVPKIVGFIEELTNWYIRLNRRRFWGESLENSKQKGSQEAAFSTLYTILLELSKLLAPFAPFVSERIYGALRSGISELPESVHLCDFPKSNRDLVDEDLENRMKLLRNVVENGRSLRQKHKLKIRQPLASLTVVSRNKEDQDVIEKAKKLILSELNVKKIEFSTEESRFLTLTLKPNLRTLGVRFGAKLKEISKELGVLSASQEKVFELVYRLEKEGKAPVGGEILGPNDFLIQRRAKGETLIATEDGITSILDTKLTDELILEGLARELVNRIQNLRKDSGLNVTDRIHLQIFASEELLKAARLHERYILEETLAKQMQCSGEEASLSFENKETYQIEDKACIIALEIIS